MSDRYSAGSEDSTSGLNEPDTTSSSNAKPTSGDAKSLPNIGPESRSHPMSEKSLQSGTEENCLTPWPEMGEAMRVYDRETFSPPIKPHSTLISSAEDSPAKTSQLPESEPDLPGLEAGFSTKQSESLTLFSETEDGFLLRMYPDSFPQTVAEISESFSRRWPTSGFTTSPGECWTADSSPAVADPQSPNGEGGYSSLPDALEADVPPRFYLSPKAAAGILRRAEKRNRALPEHLDGALRAVAEQTEPPKEAPKQGVPRRLTPTECERLQGFPDGWTILHSRPR